MVCASVGVGIVVTAIPGDRYADQLGDRQTREYVLVGIVIRVRIVAVVTTAVVVSL